MRPRPWTPQPVPTVWLDATTGTGIDDTGVAVQARVQGRQGRPTLADLLDVAARTGAERIMLTGQVPQPASAWLLTPTPGWTGTRHWLDHPPTGRFHPQGRAKGEGLVTIKTVAEWFGDLDLTPQQARAAWHLLDEQMAQASSTSQQSARLMHTPAATAMNAWAISLPDGLDTSALPAEITDLIHTTTGQHRRQHLTAGPSACGCGACVPLIDPAQDRRSIEVFGYVDGRWMYAAAGLTKELGGGPASWLTGDQTRDLLAGKGGWYTRGRIKVRFTVPDTWHHVGILGVQTEGLHPEAENSWHYPNRPGYTGLTWADITEVHLAHTMGWKIQPLESIVLTRGRWLETWRDRLVRTRQAIAERGEVDPVVRAAAAAGVRMILLQGIGTFYSRGRAEVQVLTPGQEHLPAGADPSTVQSSPTGVYYVKVGAQARPTPYYQPHLSAQVWGAARRRVLAGPAAGQWAQLRAQASGVLTLPPPAVLGIYGDAIYLADGVPLWALPTEVGGGDDGQPGRLRLQGTLLAARGRMRTPPSTADRDRLRVRALAAGPQIQAVLAAGVTI